MNNDVFIGKASISVFYEGKTAIDAFGNNFKNEQEFKTAWINYLRGHNFCEVFEIENEEKEPGFPDLLYIDLYTSYSMFFEIKVAEKGGVFKFEPTQPKFYKLHPKLRTQVIVWDAQERKVYCIGALRAAQAALEFGRATPKGIYLNVREI